jgi:hypothetical protein
MEGKVNGKGNKMEHNFIKMCGSFREELARADDETLWKMVADITLILNQPGHEISKENSLFICWYALLHEVKNTADYRLENKFKGE